MAKKTQQFLYGFVFFRQVADKELRRGYYQKVCVAFVSLLFLTPFLLRNTQSVVVLTHLPYPEFFRVVCRTIALAFFEDGTDLVEAACMDICQWPAPAVGR